VIWFSIDRSEKYMGEFSSMMVESFPTEMTVDPNEPTYCICKQVSFGEMIACDNEAVRNLSRASRASSMCVINGVLSLWYLVSDRMVSL
jgi:hypothetical protein